MLLPEPSEEMRRLIGNTDRARFETPLGREVLIGLPEEAFDSVLDFGCGCGRLARWLIQRSPRPRRYLGIDLHAGMVQWCRTNLTPVAPEFEFQHQDVFNAGLNPGGTQRVVEFPTSNGSVTLVLAWSVFTHLLQSQIQHYLDEVARVLRPGGYFVSTWFLFDKPAFPMMLEFQNALYINDVDPTNAVIFDRSYLRQTIADRGLKIITATPPPVRGFQWTLVMTHVSYPSPEVDWPDDNAPVGLARPPLMPADADKIGLDSP
jgi:SAM-dependent methyltransferase